MAVEGEDNLVSESRTEPRLLEFLVCPLTKGALSYDAERQELVSAKGRVAYPIRNGVPLLTAEAARSLDLPLRSSDEKR